MRVNSLMASPSKSQSSSSSSSTSSVEDENGLRRGPWTVDEDALLVHSISVHGEGRWNLLATRSGLRRIGKSCRLRWLNYLKPEVKRGNLSTQKQLLILDLHSRWGNRLSKIAQQLPGRTDNEINNYWRTRVQKQAKLLNIDTNSPEFKDTINRFWIPRLVHQLNESSSTSSSSSSQPTMADDTRSMPSTAASPIPSSRSPIPQSTDPPFSAATESISPVAIESNPPSLSLSNTELNTNPTTISYLLVSPKLILPSSPLTQSNKSHCHVSCHHTTTSATMSPFHATSTHS